MGGRSRLGARERRDRRELLERLRADADRIAERFGLQYTSLEAERINVKSRYGICYDDGSIKIRLNHAVTGRPLKYSSLVATLCHELAHLRHFNHGPRFQAFNDRVLAWARQEGIYRPGARVEEPRGPERSAATVSTDPASADPLSADPPSAGPLQLSLFDLA